MMHTNSSITQYAPIETPVRFQARFSSPCASCGKKIDTGSYVHGVRKTDPRRPRGYSWTVWHDTTACMEAALTRGYFMGDPSGASGVPEVEAQKTTKAEENWLAAYDE